MTEGTRLDRRSLTALADSSARVELPPRSVFDLPERVVQFGTGAFLRAFVEYFVDEGNRRGVFGGRVVAVASTPAGGSRHRGLEDQDGLYTLVTRGSDSRTPPRVIAAISRVIPAASRWSDVLACARAPELELVFSNTTEVGIAADAEDSMDGMPPRSFPGKLTRFLHERASAFDFAPDRGIAVVPCELIENNGDQLRDAVVITAERWKLGSRFLEWLDAAVPFCNTLVDRIVPSLSDDAERARLGEQLGYVDALATICEPYRLFAIQADERARRRLVGFASADPAIVLCDDVTPYRERKLRLLNGTHTTMAGIGLVAGLRFVNEAMANGMGPLVRQAMHDEIVPHLAVPDAAGYADDVLARFTNPAIQHELMDIMLHATTKMRVRVVPLIRSYAAARTSPPPALTLGFAALLLCLRDMDVIAARARRSAPQDDGAARIRDAWRSGGDAAHVAGVVSADTTLWGEDLSRIPGFTSLVAELLAAMMNGSAQSAVAHVTGGAR